MYGSKLKLVEMLMTQKCRNCGKVKISPMKYHIMLKALSRLQAQRDDLKV